jgi:hypothetical protein
VAKTDTAKEIANGFQPLMVAIVKGVSKDEIYTYIAGFVVTTMYYIFTYSYSIFETPSLPLWITILGLVGMWFFITGLVFGIFSILNSIVTYIADKKHVANFNQQSNSVIEKSLIHYPIAAHFIPPQNSAILLNLHHLSIVSSSLLLLCPLIFMLSSIAVIVPVIISLVLMIIYYYRYVDYRRYFFSLRSLWAISWQELNEDVRKDILEKSMKGYIGQN